MKNDITKKTIILENNNELKIILATIPHEKIYIKNENGKLIVSEKPIITK